MPEDCKGVAAESVYTLSPQSNPIKAKTRVLVQGRCMSYSLNAPKGVIVNYLGSTIVVNKWDTRCLDYNSLGYFSMQSAWNPLNKTPPNSITISIDSCRVARVFFPKGSRVVLKLLAWRVRGKGKFMASLEHDFPPCAGFPL